MNKQELQSKIEELKNELSKLEEQLNKKVFKPEYGDTYYCIIAHNGEVLKCRCNDDYIDRMRYALGNCFRTEEEALFALERLKVIAELKRFAKQYNDTINWRDEEQPKWYICDIFGPAISSVKYINNNDIYFSSKEVAKQAIETIGKDRIEKYYLGIEKC